MEDTSKMSKKEDKLDEILLKIEELVNILVEDNLEAFPDLIYEETPEDALEVFRVSEKVFNEMVKRFGDKWMDGMGVT